MLNLPKKNHPKFIKPRFSKTAFGISHYAGNVEYETLYWLDKNKDPLQDDLQTCMKRSEIALIAFLFENNITGIGEVGQQRGKGVNFVTVANQYKEQLQKLIDKLYSTSPHFIRCIIPNNEKKPGILEDQIVLDQLRCNGVLEGIRITRKGFPNRIIYAEFLKRYYLLGTKIPRHAPDARGAVASLLDQLGIKAAQYRFGVTKVFFKTGEIGRIEEMREKKIGELLISVQAGARGYLARQFYKRMTERTVAIRIIQRNIRVWVGFKNWPWWKLFAKVKPLFKSRNFDLEIKEKQSKIDDLAKKN